MIEDGKKRHYTAIKNISRSYYYLFIYLFKVDDIAKILHAQKIYIKLNNTRI